MAAVTNCHKLGSEDSKNVFSCSSAGQMGLTRLKSRCQPGFVLLEALGDNPFPWIFQLLEAI